MEKNENPSIDGIKKVEFVVGNETYVLETGTMAKQANGAVLVRCGETVILVSVTSSNLEKELGYLPLLVDYKERTYAAGKIPGGFFKREGRPREKEILTSRLIDRSLRPLLSEKLNKEIQIIAMVLSSDQKNDSDIPAIIGASAALGLSDIPFENLIGAVRIGKVNGDFVVNPTLTELETSEFDLVVVGSKDDIVMLEGACSEISEEDLLKAIELAKLHIKKIVEKEEEFVQLYGKKKTELSDIDALNEDGTNKIKEFYFEDIKKIVLINEKNESIEKLKELKNRAITQFEELIKNESLNISKIIDDLLYEEVRRLIVNEGKRPDGRALDEVRNIGCKVGILPRTHGSGLFTRGQTQALVVTTLGTSDDMQIVDGLEKEYKKRFMLHYNFLPFSTGEVKPERGAGRREIGHGVLAERSLTPILPKEDDFPYTIRIVSDILESNGSSSMASVCGGTLSLMDAGVPISAPVAGIAMGLIKEGDKFVVLTDIQGMEDHLGDMDFKLAGTRKGITALQMDIKIKGISMEILKVAIEEARKAKVFILDEIEKAIKSPREDISPYAPKMLIIQIDREKIRDVIGAGGKTIRKITEQTGVEINIEDDGRIFISAVDSQKAEEARQIIESITADVEVGKIYNGKVMNIVPFGAFVEILPGKEGLVHISQLDEKRVNKVEDVVKEGDMILVKVMEIDNQKRINLSRKQALKEKSE